MFRNLSFCLCKIFISYKYHNYKVYSSIHVIQKSVWILYWMQALTHSYGSKIDCRIKWDFFCIWWKKLIASSLHCYIVDKLHLEHGNDQWGSIFSIMRYTLSIKSNLQSTLSLNTKINLRRFLFLSAVLSNRLFLLVALLGTWICQLF